MMWLSWKKYIISCFPGLKITLTIHSIYNETPSVQTVEVNTTRNEATIIRMPYDTKGINVQVVVLGFVIKTITIL